MSHALSAIFHPSKLMSLYGGVFSISYYFLHHLRNQILRAQGKINAILILPKSEKRAHPPPENKSHSKENTNGTRAPPPQGKRTEFNLRNSLNHFNSTLSCLCSNWSLQKILVFLRDVI